MKDGALAILLGKPKGKSSKDKAGEYDEGEVPDEGLVATAGEVREALEANDDEALATALKSFWEQC